MTHLKQGRPARGRRPPRAGVELKKEYRATYVTAPPLPVNFVERPEALEALRDVEPFRAESPRSRLLFTTRDASIAAALGAQERDYWEEGWPASRIPHTV